MDHSSEPTTETAMDLNKEPTTEPSMDLNSESSTEPAMDFDNEPSNLPTMDNDSEPGAEFAMNQSSQHSILTDMDPNGESSTEADMDLEKEPSAEPSVDHNNDPSTLASIDLNGGLCTDSNMDLIKEPNTEPSIDLNKDPNIEASVDYNSESSTLNGMDLIDESSTEPAMDDSNGLSTESSMETCNEPTTSSNREADKEPNSTTETGPELLDIKDKFLKPHAAPSIDRRAKLAAAHNQLAQNNKPIPAKTTQITETVNNPGFENTSRMESSVTTPETAPSPQAVKHDEMATTPTMECNEMAPMAAMSSQGCGASVPSADESSITETTQPSCPNGDYSVLPDRTEFPTGGSKFPTAGDEDDDLFVPTDDITMNDIGALQTFTYGQPSVMNETVNENQEYPPKPALAQVNREPAVSPGDTAANDDTHCEDPEWPETLLNSVNDQDSSEYVFPLP